MNDDPIVVWPPHWWDTLTSEQRAEILCAPGELAYARKRIAELEATLSNRDADGQDDAGEPEPYGREPWQGDICRGWYESDPEAVCDVHGVCWEISPDQWPLEGGELPTTCPVALVAELQETLARARGVAGRRDLRVWNMKQHDLAKMVRDIRFALKII